MKRVPVGAEIDVACRACKKPIDLRLDILGNVTRCKRAILKMNENETPSEQGHKYSAGVGQSIHIGTNYGPVAVGGNATSNIMIYEAAVKAIDEAKNVSEKEKQEAKGILVYVKDHAPAFMSIVASVLMKTLGA